MASRTHAAGAWLLLLLAACGALQLSDREKACVAVYRVLYPQDDTCYQLGVRGPCAEGDLLFLDDSEAAEGEEVKPTLVCKRCRCCHMGSTAVFWNATGECLLQVSDGPRVCPLPGTRLRTDPFGLGECACLPGHERANQVAAAPAASGGGTGGGSGGWGVPLFLTTAKPPAQAPAEGGGRCWPLFQRGPCARGQVLLPGGDCGPDQCPRENAGAAAGAAFVPLDGRCRRLGAPCPRANAPANATVGLSPYTGNPTCLSDTDLNLVDAPANCPTAAGGEGCEKVVNVPKDGDDYYQKLLEAAEKRRRKRRVRPNAVA